MAYASGQTQPNPGGSGVWVIYCHGGLKYPAVPTVEFDIAQVRLEVSATEHISVSKGWGARQPKEHCSSVSLQKNPLGWNYDCLCLHTVHKWPIRWPESPHLPQTRLFTELHCHLLGSYCNSTVTDDISAETLKQVSPPVVPYEVCRSRDYRWVQVKFSMICCVFTLPDELKSVCQVWLGVVESSLASMGSSGHPTGPLSVLGEPPAPGPPYGRHPPAWPVDYVEVFGAAGRLK
ncbi:hypothetical protein P4O66_013916, partial [Electrophorus voltai]